MVTFLSILICRLTNSNIGISSPFSAFCVPPFSSASAQTSLIFEIKEYILYKFSVIIFRVL